jgi:N-acetylmuramoyl-L-alanine amidase
VTALRLGCLLLAAAAAACTTGPRIDKRYTAKGQDSRVLHLVIHYTVGDFRSSLKILTEGDVSAHYLISDEDPPRIYGLVDESRRAWHAGPSYWRGHVNLNASSIGIEIVNPGFKLTERGREWQPFDQRQIDLLIPLVQGIVRRHGIRPERVLGHSDIQPATKHDPGPQFPWKRLADLGLIPWPDASRLAQARPQFDAQLPDVAWFQHALAAFGFDVPRSGVLDKVTRDALVAFQMKYRNARFDGLPDAETAALLYVLNTGSP